MSFDLKQWEVVVTFERITKALKAGNRLHAFRSGGGLRVVRIENPKKDLVGYGEDTNIQAALANVEKNLSILGRLLPVASEYLSGSRAADSELDAWILNGHTFDAWAEPGFIVVEMKNPYFRNRCPQDVLEAALRRGSAEWHDRDGIIKIHQVSCKCSGGHKFGQKFDHTHWSFALETIKQSPLPRSFTVVKIGHASNFKNALENAVAAPQVEQKPKASAA